MNYTNYTSLSDDLHIRKYKAQCGQLPQYSNNLRENYSRYNYLKYLKDDVRQTISTEMDREFRGHNNVVSADLLRRKLQVHRSKISRVIIDIHSQYDEYLRDKRISFNDLIKLLKSYPYNLTYFKLINTDWAYYNVGFEDVLLFIKKMRLDFPYLSHLNLNLQYLLGHYFEASGKALRTKNLNITDLALNIDINLEVDSNRLFIENFCNDVCRGVGNLRTLQYIPTSGYAIPDLLVKTLGKLAEERLYNLRNIDIAYVQGSRRLIIDDVYNFYEGLCIIHNKLRKLRLRFDFKEADKDYNNIMTFHNMLSEGFTNIQDLGVNFSRTSVVSERDFELLFQAITKAFSNVEHLDLDFAYKTLSDSSLQELRWTLSKLYRLRSLKLRFNFSHIAPKGLHYLSRAFNNSSNNLHNLHLDFTGCDIDFSEDFSKLVQAGGTNTIRSLQLSLDLAKPNPVTAKGDDNGLIALSELFYAGFTHLQSLSLSLHYRNIKSTGFRSLCNAITWGPALLRDLALDFSYCKNIADDEFEALCEMITAKKKSLRVIKLDFIYCYKLTDKSLELINEALSSGLNNFKVLELDFSGCSEITCIGISNISPAMNKISVQLIKLYLKFSDCEKIKDKSFEALLHIVSGNSFFKKGCINPKKDGV